MKEDAVRDDSRAVVTAIRGAGLRVVMVTTALSPVLLLNVVGITVLYYLVLDGFKVWLFARIDLR